jgi:hypothetical protein
MDNIKKINKSSFIPSKSDITPLYFLELKFIRKIATNSIDLEATTVVQIAKTNNGIPKIIIIARANSSSFSQQIINFSVILSKFSTSLNR